MKYLKLLIFSLLIFASLSLSAMREQDAQKEITQDTVEHIVASIEVPIPDTDISAENQQLIISNINNQTDEDYACCNKCFIIGLITPPTVALTLILAAYCLQN